MVKDILTASGPAEEVAIVPDCVENSGEAIELSIADFIRARFEDEGLIFDHTKPAVVGECAGDQIYRMTIDDALRWADQWTFQWKKPCCFISIPATNGVFVLQPDNEEYLYQCCCINTSRLPEGDWTASGRLYPHVQGLFYHNRNEGASKGGLE